MIAVFALFGGCGKDWPEQLPEQGITGVYLLDYGRPGSSAEHRLAPATARQVVRLIRTLEPSDDPQKDYVVLSMRVSYASGRSVHITVLKKQVQIEDLYLVDGESRVAAIVAPIYWRVFHKGEEPEHPIYEEKQGSSD